MPSSDMKLLMETWRKYSDLVENSENFGSIYLFENKTAVKRDFETVLQEFDNGKLSEDELYEHWEKSVLYEQKLLKEEIGIDWEKEGELVQDPDYKTPQERRASLLDTATAKASDWLLEKTIQLYQILTRGTSTAFKAIVKGATLIVRMVKKFEHKNPVLAKVIFIVIIMLLVIGIMALFAAEADAAVAAPDPEGGGFQGKLSEMGIDTVRGLIQEMTEEAKQSYQYPMDPQDIARHRAKLSELGMSADKILVDYHEASELINVADAAAEANQAGESVDAIAHDWMNEALNEVDSVYRDAKQAAAADNVAEGDFLFDKLDRWREAGEKIRAGSVGLKPGEGM